MKGLILILCLATYGLANAQPKRAIVQVGGLTCAICAKTVQKALEQVAFVNEVRLNLNTQEYTLLFRTDKPVVLEEIKQQVEDAGFSVAKLQLVATFTNLRIETESPVALGTLQFQLSTLQTFG